MRRTDTTGHAARRAVDAVPAARRSGVTARVDLGEEPAQRVLPVSLSLYGILNRPEPVKRRLPTARAAHPAAGRSCA